MDGQPKVSAVEGPFSPNQIKRRRRADDDSLRPGEDHVETSIEGVSEAMEGQVDNTLDENEIDDSSKRHPDPDVPIQTIDDVKKSITSPRVARKDFMATATIDPLTNRIQLLSTVNSKANLKHLYGFDCGRNTYLNPEEALYLMETGKLEICINEIPISIIKARALFIQNCSSLSTERHYDGTTCTGEEYAVFKYLSSYGYRLRRCQVPSEPVVQPTTTTTTEEVKQVNSNVPGKEIIEDVEMKNGSECDKIADEVTEIEVSSTSSPLKAGENDKNIEMASSSTQDRARLKRKRVLTDLDTLSTTENTEILDIDLDDGVTQESTPKVHHIRINIEGASSTSNKDDSRGKGDVILTSVVDSTSSSPEITIYDDEDVLEEESIDKSKFGRVLEPIFGLGDDSSSSDSTIDEPLPSTSKGPMDPYTVVEVDSDVEFVDEVMFSTSQVDIQEVASFSLDESIQDEEDSVPDVEEEEEEEQDDFDYYDEQVQFFQRRPMASTSTSANVQLVNLVSSDEEDITEEPVEEVAIKKFATAIWSKFVPNSVIQLEFPPASLLPKEIYRETTASSNTYEFNMKDQGDQSDLELEKSVDELKIDETLEMSSPPPNNASASTGSPLKNWKEWRQHFVKEAHDIFNASLLGGGGDKSNATGGRVFSDDDVLDKLNLWQKNSEVDDNMELNGNGDHLEDSNGNIDEGFTYYLYAPSDKRYNKIRLGSVVKPSHRILIARNSDLVPDLVKIGQRGQENIPVLVALVQDDYEVTFLSPDLTPITSLF